MTTNSPRSAAQIFLVLAVIGAVLSAGLGLATMALHMPLRLSWVLALFLACFAIAKLALVAEALSVNDAAGEVSRTQAFGSPRLFRLWVAYKCMAALVALAAAAYVLTAGAAVVDGFRSPLPG